MKLNIEKIKKEMKRNNWRYADLAKQMKVSRQWLSYTIRKNNHPIFDAVEKFAKVLNLDEKDLIS